MKMGVEKTIADTSRSILWKPLWGGTTSARHSQETPARHSQGADRV